MRLVFAKALHDEFVYQLMKRIAEVATKCLQAMQQRFVAASTRTNLDSPTE